MSRRTAIIVSIGFAAVAIVFLAGVSLWRAATGTRNAALATAEQAFLETVRSWDAEALLGRGSPAYVQAYPRADVQATLDEIRSVAGMYVSHTVRDYRVRLDINRPATATVIIDGVFEKLPVRFEFELSKGPLGTWLLDGAFVRFPEGSVQTRDRSSEPSRTQAGE